MGQSFVGLLHASLMITCWNTAARNSTPSCKYSSPLSTRTRWTAFRNDRFTMFLPSMFRNIVNNAHNIWYARPCDAARLYQLQADILQHQIATVEGVIHTLQLSYLESTQQEKYRVLKTVRTSKWLVEFARKVSDPSSYFPGYKP